MDAKEVNRLIEAVKTEKQLTVEVGDEVKTVITRRDYLYLSDFPKGCKGQVYHAHRFVLAVPSYQIQVLVEALTGADKGLWFCCSLANFAVRYKLADSNKEDSCSSQ